MFDEKITKEQQNQTGQSTEAGGSLGQGIVIGALGMLVAMSILMGTVGVVVYTFRQRSGADFDGQDKLLTIESMIHKYYYEDVKDSDLYESMYKGMASGLDPYSEYYTAEEYAEEKIQSEGNYSGIGALLTQDSDTMAVYVVRAYEDSPAEKAGLKANDEIVSVDGHKAKDESLDLFVHHLRGDDGTSMKLTYRRNGREKTVNVNRSEIVVPTVDYEMLDKKAGIGLVTIYSFENGTADDFREAMDDLASQGMKAVIYDLRTNGGGLVDSVTDILDVILPQGTTVYMLDKNGKKTVAGSDDAHQIKIPSVVLTSGNTASSAEIFTGALRDYKWATIIGTKTYGKGVVQGCYPLVDGSALKVTIAKYYTPRGVCIDGDGIKPDISLEYKYSGRDDEKYNYKKDNQVQRAIRELKKQIH